MQGRPTMLQCLVPVPSSLPAAAAKRRHTSKGTSASTALFLASASKQLARSLDVQVTLDRMAQVSVPDMGDACVILRFVDGRTTIELAAAPHGDAARQPLLTALTHLAVREPHGWQPLLSAASSGRAVMLSQLETAELLGDGRPAHVLLNDIGLKTALLVPVIHEERTLAVAVFFANRARYYTPLRVRAAQDLAGRFALAFAAAYAFQDSNGLLNETQEAVAAAIHDLSSPLTYIKGTVHGLRRAEQSVTDANPVPELSVRLNAIDVAVNRMTATLAALQQITRSVPSAPTPREGADLVAITHRVVGLEQLVARDHSIRVSETPVELRGFWDTVQLERLLANLIGNAVKYSPTGTCVDIQLRAEADTDGPWAVLQVSDQGVGIPACDLPFVFEPFRRGSNVGSVAGTGLGLASVYQIVKACAGRLGIDSKEGRGTSISVRLPLAEQAAN